MPDEYTKIAPETAKGMIDSGALVLDVRAEEEFQEMRIPGAVLLPIANIITAPNILADVNRPVVVYCRSGRRSARAVQALLKLGIRDVYDMGGIIDWPFETVSGKI